MSHQRGHSSVVEHSTADREVTGSNPVAPFIFIVFFFSSFLLNIHLPDLYFEMEGMCRRQNFNKVFFVKL